MALDAFMQRMEESGLVIRVIKYLIIVIIDEETDWPT